MNACISVSTNRGVRMCLLKVSHKAKVASWLDLTSLSLYVKRPLAKHPHLHGGPTIRPGTRLRFIVYKIARLWFADRYCQWLCKNIVSPITAYIIGLAYMWPLHCTNKVINDWVIHQVRPACNSWRFAHLRGRHTFGAIVHLVAYLRSFFHRTTVLGKCGVQAS